MNIWQSASLSRQNWLVHGTATLAFGSTRYPNEGEDDATAENRATFLRALALDPSRLVIAGNVHGKNVGIVDSSVPSRVAGCDGLATNASHIVLATKTADCLPIFIADPRTKTVAIAHAGWKGVMAGVATEGVRAVVGLGSNACDLLVAIGPSIGLCHYAIHDGRRDEMLARTPFVSTGDFSNGRVDLRAIVVRQLVASGVVAENIDASAPCTACHPDAFASYFLSRDPSVGMLSAMAIRPRTD